MWPDSHETENDRCADKLCFLCALELFNVNLRCFFDVVILCLCVSSVKLY